MTAKTDTGTSPNFEQSMERLEAIVGDMEGGALSLDVMIQRFEEGQSLIKFCTGKLDEVERKIEKLLSSDGEVVTEPFGDEPCQSDEPGKTFEESEDSGELLF